MKYSEIRIILKCNLSRQQLIDFIKRNDKDRDYSLASFAWHTDEQLRDLVSINYNPATIFHPQSDSRGHFYPQIT